MGLTLERAGKRYAHAAHHADFALTEWTWPCCVRFNAYPGTDETQVIIQKGDTTEASSEARNYYLLYIDESGTKKLAISFVDTTNTKHTLSYAIDLELGRWYSVVHTFDNSTKEQSLYLAAMEGPTTAADGAYTKVISATYPGKTPKTTNTRPLLIGAGLDAVGDLADQFADCTVCELACYSDALSKATLDSRLGQRLTGSEANLVAYWPLDDGTGRTGDTQTAYDRSGSAHSLTLVNRPAWSDDPSDIYYATGIHGRNACIGYYDSLSHYDPIGPTVPTITGSDDETGREADFLLSPRACAVTRIDDTSGNWVLSFGRATPCSMVVLSGHNWTSAATITLELHTAASWGSPAVSETVTWAPDPICHFLALPYQYAYMRLVVVDAANPDGYLQLGALRPFAVWEASRPGDMTDALNLGDLSSAVETAHGDRKSRTRAKPRTYSMELSSLPTGEARELTRVLRGVGNGGYVWICDDPQRHLRRHGIYGVLSGDITESLADASGYHRHVRRLTVTEDTP